VARFVCRAFVQDTPSVCIQHQHGAFAGRVGVARQQCDRSRENSREACKATAPPWPLMSILNGHSLCPTPIRPQIRRALTMATTVLGRL
jgi:hypothetical protein